MAFMGKTDILFKFTNFDIGPLNIIRGEHFSNFRGGSYYLTTTKSSFIKLYRLHGGNSSASGQYWTTEPMLGNEAYRYDAGVLKQWNSLEQTTELIVPRGVHMYEGLAGAQKNYLGGGEQVFIPQEVVRRLFNIQQNINDTSIVLREMKEIEHFQTQIEKEWKIETIRLLQSRALESGSNLHRLPPDVRRFLSTQTSKTVTPGEYILHHDSMPALGGGRKNVIVSVKIEYVRTETRRYKSGNTNVTKLTHFYNQIMITKYI